MGRPRPPAGPGRSAPPGPRAPGPRRNGRRPAGPAPTARGRLPRRTDAAPLARTQRSPPPDRPPRLSARLPPPPALHSGPGRPTFTDLSNKSRTASDLGSEVPMESQDRHLLGGTRRWTLPQEPRRRTLSSSSTFKNDFRGLRGPGGKGLRTTVTSPFERKVPGRFPVNPRKRRAPTRVATPFGDPPAYTS